MATPGPELYQYQPGDPRLPDGDRGSKLLAPLRAEGGKSVAIAVVSTVVFFVVLALIVVNSPGWAEVKQRVLQPRPVQGVVPGHRACVLREHAALHPLGGPDPRRSRCWSR